METGKQQDRQSAPQTNNIYIHFYCLGHGYQLPNHRPKTSSECCQQQPNKKRKTTIFVNLLTLPCIVCQCAQQYPSTRINESNSLMDFFTVRFFRQHRHLRLNIVINGTMACARDQCAALLWFASVPP